MGGYLEHQVEVPRDVHKVALHRPAAWRRPLLWGAALPSGPATRDDGGRVSPVSCHAGAADSAAATGRQGMRLQGCSVAWKARAAAAPWRTPVLVRTTAVSERSTRAWTFSLHEVSRCEAVT